MENRNVHANCVKIQFGSKSKMPADKEVFAYFRRREWAPESLYAMFREPREYSVYVKFSSEDVMKAALLKCPASDTFTYDNGETTQVTFATARGEFRYVRIFGLPVEVDEKHVAAALAKYGKIHHMVRERYGPDTGYPILNGVRGAHMEISNAIPPQLHVQHFQVRVFYEGMPNKCFVCGSSEHVKANCPKRTSLSDRLKQNTSSTGSYVGAVLGGPPKSTPEKVTEQLNMVKLPVPDVPTRIPAKSPSRPNNEEDTGSMEVADEGGVADVGGRDTEASGDPEFKTPAAPVEQTKPEVAKASQEVEGDEVSEADDQPWEKAKKRGRTPRKPETPRADGSDSSDPESKLRLLDKQVERTRSRSQRRPK